VRDATHFRFYVNGISDVVRRVSALPSGLTNIWIGGVNDGATTNDFYGQIQDVRIYTSVKYPGTFLPTLVRIAYVAPSTVDTLTFTGNPNLAVGVVCTIKLSGTDFNPVSVVVPRLTVHVFNSTGQTTKPPSPNCLVTAYDTSTGVITFKATPTTTGSNRRVVVFVDSPTGVTVALEEPTDLTVSMTPVRTITSNAGGLSTRVFNGNTYTAIRNSGTLNISGGTLVGEVLMVAGGGGGLFAAGGSAGAGGIAYISSASINATTYNVTIGAGGAGSVSDGTIASVGGNTTAFGITVNGGGFGATNGGSGGGATNSSHGTELPATGTSSIGTYTSFGNRGGRFIRGGSDLYTNLAYSGGGGAGGPGGDCDADIGAGTGGMGKDTWSDWLMACGIGEGDTSDKYWIGGGGGGPANDVSGQVRSRAGGLGGGGRGGAATVTTGFRTEPMFAGIATSGIPYSGGGGGSGVTKDGSWTFQTSGYTTFKPGSSGGDGVIIIKQYGVASAPTIPSSPRDGITGLVVWLDGSDPNGDNNTTTPADNAGISSWVDKVAGNAHSAVPISLGAQAKFRRAGNVGGIKNTIGTMFFSNSGYRIPYTSFPQNFTIISLFRVERALNTDGTLFSFRNDDCSCYVLSGNGDCKVYFGIMSGNFQAGVGNGSNGWLAGGVAPQTPTTLIRGQWVIGSMTYDQSNKVTRRYINGIEMSSTTDTSAQAQWNDMYIGLPGPNGSNYRLNGYIAEILIYDRVLAPADRQKVEAYVTSKYGFGVGV
jgi:hypothetical protein